MIDPLPVLEIGVDHHNARLAVLERAHRATVHTTPAALLAADVQGLVQLVTCHRVELYLEGARTAEIADLCRWWLDGALAPGEVTIRTGIEAGRHLLRTAAGLESAVLGEDSILGQLRALYREACSQHLPGPFLHRLFHTAFRTGKRARSETPIQQGCRSLAGAAVSFINDRTGGLQNLSILVLGAGEMGRRAASRLKKRGAARILVANRTFHRAQELARDLGGEPVPWAWRVSALGTAGGVIIATRAGRPILDRETLQATAAGRTTPLVMVDLSVPRNIELPSPPIENLVTADVSTLGAFLEANHRQRHAAIAAVEHIVEQELDELVRWAGTFPGTPAGLSRASGSGR